MTNLEQYISKLKTKSITYKEVKIYVPVIKKEIDFVITLTVINGKTVINEYIYGLDSKEDEMMKIELWVNEFGGASILAKSIGMIDTHYTF